MSEFNYYRVSFKLIREMLGTGTEGSIYHEHVLQKAKKEIKKANRLGAKITKSLDKYQGDDISKDKEVAELQAVIRAYQEVIGQKVDVPDTIEALLELAKEVEEEYNEIIKNGTEKKATVFLRDENSKPIVSTHMILGNLKENMRVMVNNGDKSILKSKVSVGEVFALDVKAIEEFMTPDKDILRDENGNRLLCERPIRFNRMGKEETAIALSEQLPVGTTFSTILRIRKASPITQEMLSRILDLGKNNGLGAWRGSGNKGAYLYKLENLPEYKETFEDGWQ